MCAVNCFRGVGGIDVKENRFFNIKESRREALQSYDECFLSLIFLLTYLGFQTTQKDFGN